MSLEVLGGFHEVPIGMVKQLGQALAHVGGQDEVEVIKHLFGKLSIILLMRGNSQLILSRNSHNENYIDGNLEKSC